MHLLCIDGSGTVKNPKEPYFILAGVAVFERQIYRLIKEIDGFVHNLGLNDSESAEAPLFVDSRMSRIIQLADLAAWAVWRRYSRLGALQPAR